MAGAAARDEGDLVITGGGGGRGKFAVYDLVLLVEGDGGVCQGDGAERGLDEGGGVVYEVFCCRGRLVLSSSYTMLLDWRGDGT